MHLTPAEWLLAITPIVVQLLLLTTMVKRNYRATFPILFNYVIANLVAQSGMALVAPHLAPMQYFYAFWTITAVIMILGFGALYEVFVYILKPYSALVDLGKLLFRWAMLFLFLASLLTAVVTNGSQAVKICTAIQVLERSIELMQCGLLLLFVLFEKRLGLPWRSPAVCIMLGIGVSAAVDLSRSYLRTTVPTSLRPLDLLNDCVYIGMFALWLVSMRLAQPRQQTVQDSPTRLILQRWNDALLATPLVVRNNQVSLPVESFLPGVERAVERVMARKMAN
jgi:hypothetical protein